MTDSVPILERPLLRGERVWLHPIEEHDLPAMVAAVNDADVGGVAGFPMPQSLAQATTWLNRVLEGWGETDTSSRCASLATTGSRARSGCNS